MGMKAADRLADYVWQARFGDFPAQVIVKAKELILDSVGCALGATQTQTGKTYVKLAAALGGPAEATVIGGRAKVSHPRAAFVNSHLANLLDFDDTHDVYPPGHPGCLIIPSALAVAEVVGASGKELLTSVVLGYEVTLRLGRALGSNLWQAGHLPLTSLVGPAVAAAKLLGLDGDMVRNTLDILTLQSGLTVAAPRRRKADISSSLTLGNLKGGYGKAAEQGVLAAWEAKAGLTGNAGLLDLDLTDWFLLGLPVPGYDLLTDELGKAYWIMDMSLKPTPSCRWTHPAITAVWQALDNRAVRADEVSEVIIIGVERLQRYEWDTMLEAQFSLPCALALAMVGAEPGPGWYTTGRFKEADIRELASRVTYVRDPEAEALEIRDSRMTCAVEVVFEDGQTRSSRAESVKGAPDNPMSRDEVLAKFAANASFMTDVQIDGVIGKVEDLEEMEEVGALLGEC